MAVGRLAVGLSPLADGWGLRPLFSLIAGLWGPYPDAPGLRAYASRNLAAERPRALRVRQDFLRDLHGAFFAFSASWRFPPLSRCLAARAPGALRVRQDFPNKVFWRVLRDSPRFGGFLLVGEVARSSAALAWRWLVAGPGFPSGSNSGLRYVFSLLSPCGVIRCEARPRAGDSARDATPSFQGIGMSSESPLNIRTGSHPERKGTRLSERIRGETGRRGLVKRRVGQRASRASANAMLSPGPVGPALVKSCER